MEKDPTSLDDDQFARAFQQLTRGEEPTGTKWRPTWEKPEPYNTTDVAREALVRNVDSFLAFSYSTNFETQVRFKTENGHRVYLSHEGDGDTRWIVPSISGRSRRLLGDSLSTFKGDVFNSYAVWSGRNENVDGMHLRKFRHPFATLTISSMNPKGNAGKLRKRLDLQALYRFLRGTPKTSPYKGEDQSLEARMQWLIDNPAEFVLASDGTEFWEHLGAQTCTDDSGVPMKCVSWQGIDDAGQPTGLLAIFLV